MSLTSESLSVPPNPAVRRLESIDLLRGLLMLLMALDHTRDYFSSVSGVDPTDPLHSWPTLFATRWITHLCAPGFIALAGTSVFLQRQRGKSLAQTRQLLVTRGAWLIFLEVTLISFGWSFSLAPALLVIWAIGVSMIFLALLLRVPTAAIGMIGAAIVVLHNLFDSVRPASFGQGAVFWTLLHEPGPLRIHGRLVGFDQYPVVPWIGVICLGYAFGLLVLSDARNRQRISLLGAGVFLSIFTLLRVFHGYGDHYTSRTLLTRSETLMSFLEVEKYPPSLQYLLATLGALLVLYAIFDVAVTRDWLPLLRAIVETYGRVPFFYYVVHIYILHLLAILLTASRYLDWHFWFTPGAVFLRHLDGWGYGLPGVYAVWFLVVLVLYLPCRWFSRLKDRRKDWWLSYL